MRLRQKKVNDQIRDILATSLSRGEISDPRLSGVMITRVVVTSDLQLANIYFRFFSEQNSIETALDGFNKSKSYVRKILADQMLGRRVPELRFHYDNAQDNADRIEGLLHKIDQEEKD
jgi:ribosome-binding factor A